ncbi:MAG: hypothetical protein JNK79_01475 [Chitinophagaceae bacterium]|nr:hypothetical protein [Chitinophagaceae bacterium]
MNRILLIAVVLFFSLNVKSQQQQEYFVFIQETSRQPFYVRMGEVSHSSSATGHIIVSQLRDSVYNFFIGFPKGRSPEQLFTITMNRKDHGYELKNMGGQWQLFDLQTLQLIEPASKRKTDEQTVMRTDSYSALMANVVDDSAVLFSVVEDTLTTDTVQIAAEVKAAADSASVSKPAETKPVTTKTAVKKTTPKNTNKDTTTSTATEKPVPETDTTTMVRASDDTAVANPLPLPQVPFVPQASSGRDKRDIIRLIMENVSEGKMMIYVDRTGPVNDTIRIVIPRP